MKRPLLLTLLLAAAACGDDRFEFSSLAREPEGEPVVLRYRLKPGDRYVQETRVTMTVQMGEGESAGHAPAASTLGLTFEVREVLPDGRYRLTVTADLGLEHELGGADAAPGEMLLTPTGEMEVVHWPGGEGALIGSAGLAGTKGLGGFFRFPERGLRVGEALDFRRFLAEEALGAAAQAPAGFEFEFEGEVVLDRLETREGEPAAVFLVNIVAAMVLAPEEQGALELDLRLQGEVGISTATGMPVGTTRITSEAEGEVSQDGRTMDVTILQDLVREIRRE